jgi:hypothetical protein
MKRHPGISDELANELATLEHAKTLSLDQCSDDCRTLRKGLELVEKVRSFVRSLARSLPLELIRRDAFAEKRRRPRVCPSCRRCRRRRRCRRGVVVVVFSSAPL